MCTSAGVLLAQESLLFNKRDDRIIHWLGYIGLAATLADLAGLHFFDFHFFTANQFVSAPDFIADYLFFNTLHVPITLCMLIMLPEFKNWNQHTKNNLTGSFLRDAVFAYLILFTLFFFGRTFESSGFHATGLVLYFSFLTMHNAGQVRGLSTIMSINAFKKYPSEKARLDKIFNRERYFFTIIVIGQLRALTGVLFRPTFSFAIPYSVAIAALGVIGLMINCGLLPHEIRNAKLKFLIRLALYPVTTLSIVGQVAASSNHGLEYLIVTKNIAARSSESPKGKQKFYLFTAVCIALWGILELYLYFPGLKSLHPSPIFPTKYSMALAFVILHVWMDRGLFRMRDPVARAQHGKLLGQFAPSPAILMNERPSVRETSLAA